jgi:C4-dicarboxylate transporter, DctM subunit
VSALKRGLHWLDFAFGRLERGLAVALLALLLGGLLFGVGLKGLSSGSEVTGFFFRAAITSLALAGLASTLFRRRVLTVSLALLAVGVAWPLRLFGVEWFQNLAAWIQEASVLCWFGGLRGLSTRVTVALIMVGAALATADGRHVSIDVLTRWLDGRSRQYWGNLNAVLSAAVCVITAIGFFDFVAIDSFGARSEDSWRVKTSQVAQVFVSHVEDLHTQLSIDLFVAPRILKGTPYQQSLDGEEWNRLVASHSQAKDMQELDTLQKRVPLLMPPNVAPRSLLLKDLNLLIPFGLLWVALRFLLWMVVSERSVSGGSLSAGRTLWVLGPISLVTSWLAGLPAAAVAWCALCGLPLFAVMAGATAMLWTLQGSPLNRLAPKVFDESFAGSPVLVTIPLFTVLGYVLAQSQAPKRIVTASRALVGFLPGGMALVCLLGSVFFTALSGGSGISIVAIGGLLYPTLRSQKYSEHFSLGLATTGGSLGLLFPPALPVLIYGLVAGLDFQLIFLSAALPGLLVLGLLALYAMSVGHLERIERDRFEWKLALAALQAIKFEMLIPLSIVAGLASGATSIDESAALALGCTVLVCTRIHRDLNWAQLSALLREAMRLAGAVVFILMMANVLMNFVIDARWPTVLLEYMSRVGLSERWQFLFALNVFLLAVGMVMDGVSALLVAVPLVIPLAARFGLSPFHLATLVILNLELAFCMPPLGLNLFIASFRFERPLASLFRAVMPFVAILTLSLGVVTGVPWLSTVLIQGTIADKRAEALRLGVDAREAWALECVQEDALAAHPCTETERNAFSTDAGTDEDTLLKEMLGP